MDPSAGAGAEGMSNAPRNGMTSISRDAVLEADIPDLVCGDLSLDWQPFGAQNQVENRLETQDSTWTGLTAPSASNHYDYSNVLGDQEYEPPDNGTFGMFGAHSHERTAMTHIPETYENVYPSIERSFDIQEQGDICSLSSQLYRTAGSHAQGTESGYSHWTADNAPFTEPSFTYDRPEPSAEEVAFAQHRHFQENHDRPMSSTRKKPPKEYKPTKSTYLTMAAVTCARLAADSIEIGLIRMPKAKVKQMNGKLHVELSPRNWVPAVYHNDIRAELVAQAPPQLYDHQPAAGSQGQLDVTTYYEAHRAWGFKIRSHRPDVCFEWLGRESSIIENPGYMRHGDLIVLDPFTNLPIQDLPMPSCISSRVEGGRMEAMVRLHGHEVITKVAIRARMPVVEGKNTSSLLGILATRMERFRDEAGLPTTNPRPGSAGKKNALVQCIPVAVMEQILVANSTRMFRDLNHHERAFMDRFTHGTKSDKARTRRMDHKKWVEAHGKKLRVGNGYRPVNPNVEPFGADILDDRTAIDAARTRRGLPQISPLVHDASSEPKEKRNSSNKRHLTHDVAVTQQRRDNEETPETTLGAHLGGLGHSRKRSRDQDTEVSDLHDNAQKIQRRRVHGGVHGESAVSRQVHCASDPQMSKEFQPRSPGYQPYPYPAMSEPVDIPAISGISNWPCSTDPGQSIPAVENQSTLPASFDELISQNDINWCSQLWPDDQPRDHSVQAIDWYPPIPDPPAIGTELDHPVSQDYRFKAPGNDEEALKIAICLQLSIQDINLNLAVEPPDLPRDQCYMGQWELLWVWYVEMCPFDPVPPIWQCTKPWFEGWPSEEMLADLRVKVGWRQDTTRHSE
ncbi:MAG: hypothetical protein LQ349_001430 [Xanthoria aureola]|nr:MAG: hypothetical protein LQ349_001430 [Xanthoria aureola]